MYHLLTSNNRCFGYAAKARIKHSSFTEIIAALKRSLTTRFRLAVFVSHRKCYSALLCLEKVEDKRLLVLIVLHLHDYNHSGFRLKQICFPNSE